MLGYGVYCIGAGLLIFSDMIAQKTGGSEKKILKVSGFFLLTAYLLQYIATKK
jgi:hypothetical protein